MFVWFAPAIRSTQVRSKILLASQLSVAGTPTVAQMKDTLNIATNKLTDPRTEEETSFLEDLASRILHEETVETASLVDRMIRLAEKKAAG